MRGTRVLARRRPEDGDAPTVRREGGTLRVIDFAAGVGAPDLTLSNRWADAVRAAEGRGLFRIVHVHLRASDAAGEPGLCEAVSRFDHLLLVLSGSVLVSGGGRKSITVEAGNGVYWPREEGYLASAVTPATALLIAGDLELNPYLGIW